MLKPRAALYFVLVLVSVNFCLAENETAIIVELETPLGKVKGNKTLSRLGDEIYQFLGVRYAEPPIGLQRFQPPIPVKPWDTFDASEPGPSCPRSLKVETPAWTPRDSELESEDCLRLDVYTKKIPSVGDVANSPVVVYFHGCFILSCTQKYAGPEYLLDHDVVLVTVNSRHSALGFMSTGDSLLPGNLGLKDQVEALRWVQKNIAAFGGDPKKVTIAGHGMGAWSVSLHMVSPMSRGLFHRAIAAGGSATFLRPLPTNQTHVAKKQAEILGCPTDTVGNMLVCLNTKAPEEFSKSTLHLWNFFKDPISLWLPVVEPEVRGVERFLPAQPIDLIKQGNFEKVPLMTGLTKYEYYLHFDEIIDDLQASMSHTPINKNFNETWDSLPAINFISKTNTECLKKIGDRLHEHYFNNTIINKENLKKLEEITVDALVIYPVHQLVNSVAENSDQPVYYYEFTFREAHRHMTCDLASIPLQVEEYDDSLYIFDVGSLLETANNSSEMKTVERMTTIWSNFAKTGEPIPKEDKKNIFNNVVWEKFTQNNKKYLEIGNELTMKTNLNVDRMKFWDELFLQKCT